MVCYTTERRTITRTLTFSLSDSYPVDQMSHDLIRIVCNFIEISRTSKRQKHSSLGQKDLVDIEESINLDTYIS